jgi:hypothetical protein
MMGSFKNALLTRYIQGNAKFAPCETIEKIKDFAFRSSGQPSEKPKKNLFGISNLMLAGQSLKIQRR